MIYERIFAMRHLKIIAESIQLFPRERHVWPLSQLYLTDIKSCYATQYSVESPFMLNGRKEQHLMQVEIPQRVMYG